MTGDKNPAYPIVIEELKKEKSIPDDMQLRQQKYLNKHSGVRSSLYKEANPFRLGLKMFRTAKQILCGVEVMHMLKKKNFNKG